MIKLRDNVRIKNLRIHIRVIRQGDSLVDRRGRVDHTKADSKLMELLISAENLLCTYVDTRQKWSRHE